MKSIIQNKKECFLCRYMYGVDIDLDGEVLEEHHAFPGTSRRSKSDEHGLVVWLCPKHHRQVHCYSGKPMMDYIKAQAMEAFLEDHTEEEFRKEFGWSI